MTIFIILLLISTATADQLENTGALDRKSAVIIKPINITNTTLNITDFNITDNITLNITDLINITENITLNITDLINITENTTIIIIPINFTNFTEFNLTKNETINLTNSSLNNTINISKTINKTKILSPPARDSEITYYYVGSKLIASKDSSGINYHYQDHLGSDINSKSLPFGQPIYIENKFPFTGKELDEDLYYFGARYYDPNIGRFTSVDPVKSEPPYQYVKNNPLRFIDPDGKETKEKYQNLILYSEAMKIKETPLILNFPTQQEVENYRTTVIDSLITSNQNNHIIDLGNGQPISLPGYGESTELPIFETNTINTLFKMEVARNGPIENVVFFMHSEQNNPRNIVLEDPILKRDTREPIKRLSDELYSLPKNYFDKDNGQIIFAICNGDSCINGQTLADSLGVNVFLSSEKIEYVEGTSPPIVYGHFNEYKPKKD